MREVFGALVLTKIYYNGSSLVVRFVDVPD